MAEENEIDLENPAIKAAIATAVEASVSGLKAAGTQVDLTSFNNAKNDLAAITDTYKNYQKELEAAQKAGLLSEEDYLLRRQALIGNELDQVTAAYEAEISALESSKAKKGISAAQSIQLDQKIADARAGMVKAQKDADSQLEVLATNETGRLANAAAAQDRAELDKHLATEQQLAKQDQQHTKELSDAKTNQARLRDRLATSDLRLSVLLEDSAGSCNVPAAPSASGVVHATRRAQLEPAHAQRIIAITDAGDQGLIALRACQAYVRAVAP